MFQPRAIRSHGLRPSTRQVLAALIVVGAGTLAAAQRFVWPPAAGDRGADSAPRAAVEAAARSASEPVLEVGFEPPAVSVRPAAGPSGTLEWKILENPNGRHTALVFDPLRQVFAVYHIDAASGEIMLKAVRNLSADLRLPHLNSGNPAPQEIESILNEAR